MKILIKSTKTGKAKTLLVFHLKENKVSKIDVKAQMKMEYLIELINRIQIKIIEFSNTEEKRLDLHEHQFYFLRQETKVFDLPKAQLYQQNIALWNSLYEQYMNNIYEEPTPSETMLFQKKKYEKEFMEAFFKSDEWYAKDKTIARFCANEKNILSSIHKSQLNNQPNYAAKTYSEDRLL